MKHTWGTGLDHLQPDRLRDCANKVAQASDPASAERVVQLAFRLAEGDYTQAIRLAVEQNSAVMQSRGGGAWATTDGNKLTVRLRDQAVDLPSASDPSLRWSSSYFVDTLKSVGSSVYREVA